MARTTNARIAGFAFLFYIAIVVASMVLFGGATGAEGTAARLASIAQHATEVRVSVVLGLLTPFVAMVLSTALYAITREQDRFLAMLAMTCLFGAGVIDGIYIPTTLGLLSLATTAGANAPGLEAGTPWAPSAVYTLGSFLLTARAWNPIIAATFFAVGSTLYSWLLLRGQLIPIALAWLGVLASVLWVVGLPLQLVGLLPPAAAWFAYLPMVVFEISVGLWLLVKGIALSPARNVAPLHADSPL
jgi:hypothetical protein